MFVIGSKEKGEKIMNECPKCRCKENTITSSEELRVSEIRCSNCGFGFSAPVPEEDIQLMWDSIKWVQKWGYFPDHVG